MENKSSEARHVEMKFSASAFYYTGVTGEEVASGEYNTALTPAEGHTASLYQTTSSNSHRTTQIYF